MSRSKRHTSITGNWRGKAEKQDKQTANRRLRRMNTVILASLNEDLCKRVREISDPWLMSKDGKFRFNPQEYPELMRK